MAVNLVSLIMQFLTPDMIGRIASALGLDRTNTQTAIGAAIPGLLAGLSGVAAQPGGAQKLVDTVRQQTGALGSFANMLIETLRQAGAVVDAKAPGDAAAFKGWLRQISQHVAEASKEGGFLGIGGVPVSEAEKATLTEISSALKLAA